MGLRRFKPKHCSTGQTNYTHISGTTWFKVEQNIQWNRIIFIVSIQAVFFWPTTEMVAEGDSRDSHIIYHQLLQCVDDYWIISIIWEAFYFHSTSQAGLSGMAPFNHCPVSNLSFLSKLLVKTVRFHLIAYLHENSLLPNSVDVQVGQSTETAILRYSLTVSMCVPMEWLLCCLYST